MTEYEIIDAMVSLRSETAQHSMNLVYLANDPSESTREVSHMIA
jgi:hypothetical protein